jgi:hypothetical protein
VIYDPVRKIAFIPCAEDGVPEIISVADPTRVALVQRLPTQSLARTGAVDPQSGRVYLMGAQPDSTKPRRGRPAPKDGSFEMLVVAPNDAPVPARIGSRKASSGSSAAPRDAGASV